MIHSEELKKYLDFAYKAYQENNITNQVYRQKGKIPYMIHPLGSAMLLIADTKIPYKERELGFKILILHDVLEDTSLKLPVWVEEKVKKGVEEMTYLEDESLENKMRWVWSKNYFYKMLILYDAFWTLYEKHVDGPIKRQKMWQKGILTLAKEVEKDYGEIQIVKISKAIAKNTY